jgi:hypothetical protein
MRGSKSSGAEVDMIAFVVSRYFLAFARLQKSRAWSLVLSP